MIKQNLKTIFDYEMDEQIHDITAIITIYLSLFTGAIYIANKNGLEIITIPVTVIGIISMLLLFKDLFHIILMKQKTRKYRLTIGNNKELRTIFIKMYDNVKKLNNKDYQEIMNEVVLFDKMVVEVIEIQDNRSQLDSESVDLIKSKAEELIDKMETINRIAQEEQKNIKKGRLELIKEKYNV